MGCLVRRVRTLGTLVLLKVFINKTFQIRAFINKTLLGITESLINGWLIVGMARYEVL